MTTSSSLPNISEILPAIHLTKQVALAGHLGTRRVEWSLDSLLHDLQIDFRHVDLLTELGWKLCALEELGIHSGRHSESTTRDVC